MKKGISAVERSGGSPGGSPGGVERVEAPSMPSA
jgi:hypothetical protein